MPLAATLGDLHAAIHALFAWEATTCTPPTGGGVHYSGVCFKLKG
jgi:hypothetical protein